MFKVVIENVYKWYNSTIKLVYSAQSVVPNDGRTYWGRDAHEVAQNDDGIMANKRI